MKLKPILTGRFRIEMRRIMYLFKGNRIKGKFRVFQTFYEITIILIFGLDTRYALRRNGVFFPGIRTEM